MLNPPLLSIPDSYGATSKRLDIIIPSYKRPHGAVEAARSVLSQVKQYNVADLVNLVIWDDSTPGLDVDHLAQELSDYDGLFRLGQNRFNKGMSGNILDLVSLSKSPFCTILTDDDWLEEGALPEILEEISKILVFDNSKDSQIIGAFFVPRYSYLEDGTLHCVECRPFTCDSLISPSPCNVIKYSRNAFILTGLFFRPALVDFAFWEENKANSFFPLLYYSSIAISSDVKFLNRKWLHHTCLNLCHWEAWGESELQQNARLHSDYLQALVLIAQSYASRSMRDRLSCAKYLSQAFIEQLRAYGGPRLRQFMIVMSLTKHSPILFFAYLSITLARLIMPLRAKFQFFKRFGSIN